MSQPLVSVGDVSIARLHGEACWDCGAVNASLAPAGEARVQGFEKAWPIRRCATACIASKESQ